MRKIGIAKHLPHVRGMAGWQECCRRVFVLSQKLFGVHPICRVPFWDGKSVTRILRCRSKNLGEFLRAESGEKFRPTVDGAGDRYGLNPALWHCRKALAFEEFDGKLGGRPAARVETVQFACFRVVNNCEKIAPH